MAEPQVAIQNAGGGRQTYERVRDDPPVDPPRWQEIHGSTRVRHGEPISAEELLERVRAVIYVQS